MTAIQGMSGRRVAAVHAAIAVLVVGSFWCIALEREYWPLSNYPMYSEIRPAGLTRLRLYGITATAEGSREFILAKPEEIWPFEMSRVILAFQRLLTAQPLDRPRIARALQDCWRRYEGRRAARRHAGPVLTGIRLYRIGWNPLPPSAPRPNQPDYRELLAETRVAPGATSP